MFKLRPSLWRELTYKEFGSITLTGRVLDLGGSKLSRYHQNFLGTPTIEVADLDHPDSNDFNFDFEKPFPLKDQEFDGVISINVLEHIYDHRQMLKEVARILKSGGQLVLAVPFLIQWHPSPNDYWRYTETTIEKLLKESGFSEVEVRPVGTGPFGASYSLLHYLFRFGLLQWLLSRLAWGLDTLLAKFAPNSHYTVRNYPLGYVVIARR